MNLSYQKNPSSLAARSVASTRVAKHTRNVPSRREDLHVIVTQMEEGVTDELEIDVESWWTIS